MTNEEEDSEAELAHIDDLRQLQSSFDKIQRIVEREHSRTLKFLERRLKTCLAKENALTLKVRALQLRGKSQEAEIRGLRVQCGKCQVMIKEMSVLKPQK